jgi:WhiB family redox-sensing transcriptional regulator
MTISITLNIRDGICRDTDSEIFFTDEESAKKVCAHCPQRISCRDGAREGREEFGVFGGESESERAEFLGISPDEKFEYSPVRDLAQLGVPVNAIAERLNLQHDSVTRNLRRYKVSHE